MTRVVYTIVLIAGLVALAPLFLFRGIRHKKYLGSLRERFGAVEIPPSDRPTLWIHAVSVGELLAAEALIRQLIVRLPSWRVVVSTTTSTGQALARERFDDVAIVYFPIDVPWAVRRAIDRIAPSVVCFVETEIWPNFLAECCRRDVRVAIVNGRISDRSYRGYSRVRRLLASFLAPIDAFLMQSESDADRIAVLGADPSRIAVTGNLKYDVDLDAHERRTADVRLALEAAFALPDGRPLVVAGSTADGEEEILARALARVRASDELQTTRLLVAPRRPERFDQVERIFEMHGFRCARRTRPECPADADVMILDTIGELAAAYALGDVVFVGGSLVPHGGQNILEPALAGRPVIVGPYTNNFRQIVADFRQASALVQLAQTEGDQTIECLANELTRLLRDRSFAQAVGQRGLRVIEENRGAVARTIDGLSPLMEATA